ncbi:MAG: 50S ribosomal protein L22 [Blastocatellia bacterium]|jgi:large subunit ribosomal protein L22|nr:50S ribosomal protein L22 [Blastocatellia bacterium]MBK6428904.1 50S ribosomal protein L22 [Blastocatellia bacterium]
MNARAITKAVQGSPQKARLVVDTIRGLRVPEALTILHFTNKRAAAMIEKTLRSAVANASNLAEEKNVSVDVDNLYVSAAMVDLGPTKHRRRRRPAPMGRAYSERRWRSHITIEVSTEKPRAVAERDARNAQFAAKKKPAATASGEA